jgi:hypothetical protein
MVDAEQDFFRAVLALVCVSEATGKWFGFELAAKWHLSHDERFLAEPQCMYTSIIIVHAGSSFVIPS